MARVLARDWYIVRPAIALSSRRPRPICDCDWLQKEQILRQALIIIKGIITVATGHQIGETARLKEGGQTAARIEDIDILQNLLKATTDNA